MSINLTIEFLESFVEMFSSLHIFSKYSKNMDECCALLMNWRIPMVSRWSRGSLYCARDWLWCKKMRAPLAVRAGAASCVGWASGAASVAGFFCAGCVLVCVSNVVGCCVGALCVAAGFLVCVSGVVGS